MSTVCPKTYLLIIKVPILPEILRLRWSPVCLTKEHAFRRVYRKIFESSEFPVLLCLGGGGGRVTP